MGVEQDGWEWIRLGEEENGYKKLKYLEYGEDGWE